jgi:hypothetical protein
VQTVNSDVNSSSKLEIKQIVFNESFDEYEFGMDTKTIMKDYSEVLREMENKIFTSIPKHKLVPNSNF